MSNKRFSVVVTTDNVNFGIPSRSSVAAVAVDNHGEDSWQVKAHHFLDQKWVQATLTILLSLDVIIIMIELFLGTEFPDCQYVVRDCLSCCPESNFEGQEARWLADGGICQAGYELGGEPGCDSYKHEAAKITKKVLFYMTIVILGIFLIENLVEMAVLGFCTFFKQVFLALDFIIVSVSFVMELVYGFGSEAARGLQMLIIFRLWRFVRIGHGIMEVASELTSAQYECLIDYVKECEKKLDDNSIKKPERSEKVTEIIEKNDHH